MKKKITFKSFMLALFSIVLIAVFAATAYQLSPIATVVVGLVLFGLAFIKRPQGALFAGLYPEVYTKEITKRFNSAGTATWRVGIPNKSQYASMTNDGETVVINMTYFGASPDVLIDNSTYPIPIQDLNGENVAISLKKYQTKATPVTDDEIRGLAYDKIKVVQESHAIKIEEEKDAMAIHSIAPANNTAAPLVAPVLVTTGADDGTGRKKLLVADILRLKKLWDDALIPQMGRRLVLCSEHVLDLVSQNQTFEKQYYDYTTGKIANMFGFEIYEYIAMPYYNVGTKVKLAYGGVPVSGTHNKASVAFYLQRVGQAFGFTKAYISESKNDPLYQRNLLNYRHYDVVLPVKNEGIAAIVSGIV